MRNQPDPLCHGPSRRQKEMHRPPGATHHCQLSPDATRDSVVMWLRAALTHTCCFPAIQPTAACALPSEAESTSDVRRPGMQPARGQARQALRGKCRHSPLLLSTWALSEQVVRIARNLLTRPPPHFPRVLDPVITSS